MVLLYGNANVSSTDSNENFTHYHNTIKDKCVKEFKI